MIIKKISAEAAAQKINQGALLVDVREKIEVADKWVDIEGVFSLPLSTFASHYNTLPKDKDLILCCAVGIASDQAASILLANGYNRVEVIEDGLIAWQTASLPMKSILDCNCQCKGNDNSHKQ